MMQPTETWLKGDLIGKSKASRKSSGWEISSGWMNTYILATAIDSVIRLPAAVQSEIASMSVSGEVKVEMSCVINYEAEDRPEINLSTQLLASLSRIHAVLDIDIYY